MNGNQFCVGFGRADITPPVGIPLSGFIARQGKPSISVDDPLMVRVLAMGDSQRPLWLVNYDLLGISYGPYELILAALQKGLGNVFDPQACVLTCTHTHSGPPVSPIEGEEGAGPAYTQTLCDRTVQAARTAYVAMQPARVRAASTVVEGLTYNRRALLADGRMTMAVEPDVAVEERGPVDHLATLLVFQGQAGQAIAGLLHFACHGVALQSQAIGGDIPGELARRFEMRIGAPCLFLQGASGDVNPNIVVSDRKTMLAWCDRFMQQASPLFETITTEKDESAQPPVPVCSQVSLLPVQYAPLPGRDAVLEKIRTFDHIAKGEWDVPEIQPTLRWLGDMMNMPAGELPERGITSFIALAFANAGRRTLAALEDELPPCPMRLVVWRVGNFTLAFAAGEILARTGLKIRALTPDRLVLPVSHLVPVIGYIPDRQAISQGGYEVDDAWQFYRQPGPFAEDTEERILHQFGKMLAEVGQ